MLDVGTGRRVKLLEVFSSPTVVAEVYAAGSGVYSQPRSVRRDAGRRTSVSSFKPVVAPHTISADAASLSSRWPLNFIIGTWRRSSQDKQGPVHPTQEEVSITNTGSYNEGLA